MTGVVLLLMTVCGDFPAVFETEIQPQEQIVARINQIEAKLDRFIASQSKPEAKTRSFNSDYMTLDELFQAIKDGDIEQGQRVLLSVQQDDEINEQWARKASLLGRTFAVVNGPHDELNPGMYHYMVQGRGLVAYKKKTQATVAVQRNQVPVQQYVQPHPTYYTPAPTYYEPMFFGGSGSCAGGSCGSGFGGSSFFGSGSCSGGACGGGGCTSCGS